MAFDFAGCLNRELNQTLRCYENDILEMPLEMLNAQPSPTSRTALDFVYECTVVNIRLTKRIRGEEPDPWPWGTAWAKAPEDWLDRNESLARFRASVEALLAAALEDPEKVVELPGETTTAFELALFANQHSVYHLAQINYIQAFYGDLAMHWKF
jgi:hypothetical protein